MTEVVTAWIERDGLVLIGKRKSVRMDGYWELPGGKVDAGETHEAALLRELQEELGIENAQVVGQVSTYSGHVGDGIRATVSTYRVELPAGRTDFALNAHHEFAWVAPDEILRQGATTPSTPHAVLQTCFKKWNKSNLAPAGTRLYYANEVMTAYGWVTVCPPEQYDDEKKHLDEDHTGLMYDVEGDIRICEKPECADLARAQDFFATIGLGPANGPSKFTTGYYCLYELRQ